MAKAKGRQQVQPRTDNVSTWQMPTSDSDRLLATSDDPRLLAMCGDDYEERRALARESLRTARAPGRRVLLVPGILGSTIGQPGNLFTRDTIWFDPASLAKGDATKLKLDTNGNSPFTSIDVLPIVHTYLRLRLRMFGYSVEYFPYDWRQSIVTLGKQLAAYVSKLGPVQVVAHSMGGLVTRAAMKLGAKNISRVVMLGTPNRGSFSVVEVLQGINSTVVLVDKLDSQHNRDDLVRDVFSTFPSIYEMIPRPDVFDKLDLFDPVNWPKNQFIPTAARLKAAKTTWMQFVEKDPRLFLIAGVEQATAIDISKGDDDGFLYHTSNEGDGTVPLKMCQLPGVPTWYVRESHTGLLRNETVAKSVAELLAEGETKLLPSDFQRARGASTVVTFKHSDFPDDQSRPRLLNGGIGNSIDPNELPTLVESAMAMSSLPAATCIQNTQHRRDANRIARAASNETFGEQGAAAARLTSGITFAQTVISRDLQTHLELELYNGNLFDVPYRAVVLGIFENVDPSGPAKTLDALTFGAVTELLSRRMFDASAGKVFVMPTGRNSLKADYVVFAGLGNYSQFAASPDSVLRTISCNILRTLMNCGVDEFATLIYGGSSGMSMRSSVESFVRGYLDALQALGKNDRSIQFRRIALCEYSKDRFAELKDETFRLGGTQLCDGIRLRLNEANYPASAASIEKSVEDRVARVYDRRPKNTVYLTARFEKERAATDQEATDNWTLHAALLGAGAKATVFPGAKQISRTKLDEMLGRLPDGNRSISLTNLLKLGIELRDLILTEDFIHVLKHDLKRDDHLAVIVDSSASRIPWEILPLLESNSSGVQASMLSCINGGVSRRFQSEPTQSLAKFLEERQRDAVLNVLLIVNPTDDLSGADREGELLERILRELDLVRVTKLQHGEATREKILNEFKSGAYDIVHYAGHAYFDPVDRGRSGLICAGIGPVNGMSVLSGQDLMALTSLPTLVFFNACESARIRKLPVPSGKILGMNNAQRKKVASNGDRSNQDAGICEAMLRGGISQFIGTYWPVNDSAAEAFSRTLYQGIAQGKTVRESVVLGRIEVKNLNQADMANYIHYGDPSAVVKDLKPVRSTNSDQPTSSN